jgi:pyruvate/2-oxoglutarate dehydrogenase complex dihydrolipoamide dehydrogenase (E3) component
LLVRRGTHLEEFEAMTTKQRYDAIIIGASRAAIYLGPTLARAGWHTAIIERDHLGGVCVNVGCTPTKTMAASARVAYVARRAAEYGVHVGPVSVDLTAVRRRKDDLVARLRMLPAGMIEQTDGVELVHGRARFASSKSVEVELDGGGRSTLSADTIVIDTGASPLMPSIPGLDSIPTLDSTTIMELNELPEHLIVLGGGYIGLEFGQMFRRFGSRVTIVQRGPQLLSREDPDVAAKVASILREDGIEVLLEADAVAARRHKAELELVVRTAGSEQPIAGSHLLVAGGRTPNTRELDLAAVGIRTDARGFVEVDEYLESSVPGVYAMGDVRPGPAFTHAAFDDFRILRANLLDGARASTRGRVVPYTVFIDPQLGRIGLTEREAQAQGRHVRVATLPMDYPGPTRARELGETRGMIKVVVDADTDQILGAAVLNVEGGEIVSVLQVAMLGKLPYTAIRDAIFSHPTLTESLNDLFMAMDMPMPMPAPRSADSGDEEALLPVA